MAKYIDIEGILSARRIEGELKVHGSLFSRYIPIEALEAMPAADVEPVRHGEWFGTECSLCGGSYMDYADSDSYCAIGEPRPDYCPNCGAKMDGGVAHEP